MSIKSDKWIKKMSKDSAMITPFLENQVKDGSISFGLTSC